MVQTVSELQRFAIPGTMTIDHGCGGLPRICVATPQGRLEVYLHGGHVTAWQPTGHAPVLWMSSQSWYQAGRPIRGGIPICWPWFGPAAEAGKPAHGIARFAEWDLESALITGEGEAHLGLRLATGAQTRAQWNHDAEIRLHVHAGRRLEVALTATNTGAQAFQVSEALHTYLQVGDVRRVQVVGIAGAVGHDNRPTPQVVPDSATLTFTDETDILFDSIDPVCVHDPILGRTIRIGKSGSGSTVVWNPWIAKSIKMPDFGDHEWPGMLCIEAANAGLAGYHLPPGASHRIATTIEVL